MSSEIFEHDATVKKLRKLAADDALRDRVTALFITSLATGVRRAMTPIMAYYAARTLPDHRYERFDFAAHNRLYRDGEPVPCAQCGLPDSDSRNREDRIADIAWCGRCSMTPDIGHLIDLEDVGNITLEYQPAHADTLRALLKVIESVPVSASTTELQKQVAAAKVMPKSNLAARLWCLRILAELGVIANASVPDYSGAFHFYSFLQRIEMENKAFAKTPHRADPVWPLSAGRGTPAVNWPLARRIFPQLGG
jgi:hypothetical protein